MCSLLFISFLSSAQLVLSPADVNDKDKVRRGIASPTGVTALKEDKIDLIEVTGIGTSAFSTSNTFDGTTSSYKHSLKITVGLLTSGANKEGFQLVFYSPTELIPYAANSDAGVTYVYYPISLYDAIKLKLDQSFAAKKKVQLKVTQKKDGFREGVLVL